MKRLLLLAAIVAVAVPFGSLLAESPKEKRPQDLVLKSPSGEAKRPPVPFPHGKHADDGTIACSACHHLVGKAKSEPTERLCSSCHLPGKCDGQASSDNCPDFQDAFHKACKTCHGPEGAGGFKKCGDCHSG